MIAYFNIGSTASGAIHQFCPDTASDRENFGLGMYLKRSKLGPGAGIDYAACLGICRTVIEDHLVFSVSADVSHVYPVNIKTGRDEPGSNNIGGKRSQSPCSSR